ncbi:N-acyl homoserine lactonase family protein [Streptacidiphilus sp. P02-A3a]|uniref:N-acyl homoserine lactonase family protein n=1 Tax=Streptacidiphilus sp. P02-A3a TaxID=2704468 RepID=UPI0015FD0BE6|nr:N-acyl homoserine lactonase family protein [Streptacidiphilus sp. P02-A3a]QMU71602.1 N-acyl homoserine lactonase family protein [Streptacidiphilus sp. P02-A3a]
MTHAPLPRYEVLALRFGTQAGRSARENFLFADDPCATDSVAPFDFYTWVIRDEERVIAVDTGFAADTAARRGRTQLHHPVRALADLAISPEQVSDLVVTHMHWDHTGFLDAYPTARVHLQQAEMEFCTGGAMRHAAPRRPFEADDVNTAVRLLFAERLRLHRGPVRIAPGVEAHPAPGHTPGLQVVRVHTERGWLVLASDSSHLWANIRRRAPFPILDHLASMVDSYEVVEALADGPDHVIPGHDPQVATRFPALEHSARWTRLHRPPLTAYREPGTDGAEAAR